MKRLLYFELPDEICDLYYRPKMYIFRNIILKCTDLCCLNMKEAPYALTTSKYPEGV